MLASRLLEESTGANTNWLVWVVLIVFALMVLLGWWVASKGWLKKEEEPRHEEHGHEAHAHEEPARAVPVHETPAPEPVSFSVEAAPVEPVSVEPDDLVSLEGIGPKVAKLLAGIGITTFKQLAESDLAKLREALDGAGYKYMEPAGWVEQAAFAARGDKEGLAKLQGELKGGRRA